MSASPTGVRHAEPQSPAAALAALTADLQRASYFPDLVARLAADALAGEPLVAHLMHCEATLDPSCVGRHLSLLLLTATRMAVIHVDDHDGPEPGAPHSHRESTAGGVTSAVTEVLPLRRISHVRIHQVADAELGPEQPALREVVLVIGWGASSTQVLYAAPCDNPECEGGCGWEGSQSNDDLSLRVSAAADGAPMVATALAFAHALAARIG